MTIKIKSIVGGLNPTRTFLLRTIKFSTGYDITTSAVKVFNLYDRWVTHEGKRSALLRAKAISHTATNYYLDQDNPSYAYLKTKEGFPSIVLEWASAKGNPKKMQACLSLLNHWRNIKAPGTPDTAPITGLCTVDPDSTIAELVSNTPISWSFDPKTLNPGHHELRSKMGPNGKAITSSALDYIALEKEGLIPFLNSYANLSNNEVIGKELLSLENIWEQDEYEPMSLYSGRISIKQELGGKDRLFCICDYWTQIILHPLHDKLASILKTIISDGTFGQDSAANQIKEWTKINLDLYSLDLKSATDRFPVKAISAILGKLTNESFGNSWCDLISNRSFRFQKENLKFGVGQPLGAYSSWPSFALAHHVVVMTAAKRANIENPQYRLLGDDIVLVSELLKDHYINIMTELGVEFSLAKSLSGFNRAEFAKRLFYKGDEITPIPMKLITKTLSDYRLSLTLFNSLILKTTWKPECKYSAVLTFLNSLKGFYPKSLLEKAWKILLVSELTTLDHNPSLYEKVFKCQGIFNLVSTNEAKIIYNMHKLQIVRKNIQKAFQKLQPMLERLNAMELPGTDYGGRRQHPIFESVKILQLSQIRIKEKFETYIKQVSDSDERIVVPNLNPPDLEAFRPSFQKTQIRDATISLNTYNSLVELQALRKISPTQISLLQFLNFMKFTKHLPSTIIP